LKPGLTRLVDPGLEPGWVDEKNKKSYDLIVTR
jgi:hypothetical protein